MRASASKIATGTTIVKTVNAYDTGMYNKNTKNTSRGNLNQLILCQLYIR